MKFVLREYLTSLKEDKELDSFVEELSKSIGLIPLTKIQRGRQFGVDLPAVGTDFDGQRKVFLFTIKQGDFNRKNWDSGSINDIRPSLNEILDVYITTRIPVPFNQLTKKIVVCCNGELEQTVNDNWTAYIRTNTSTNIEFEFWGVDKLVDLADKYQMNESILEPKLALQFRRTLSFIDIPDYDLSHFFSFLNSLFATEHKERLSEKIVIKKLRLVNLCQSILHTYCEKSDNLKPAIVCSERILLNTWAWLLNNADIEKQKIFIEYYKIVTAWRNLGHKYLLKIKDYVQIENGLAHGIMDSTEYALTTYEHIGLISAFGLFELWETKTHLQSDKIDIEHTKEVFATADVIAERILCELIDHNPASLNPKYDEHCIEIVLAFILLFETGKYQQAIQWLRRLVDYIFLNYKLRNFIPLFRTDLEKLSQTRFDKESSSILITILAEWCLIFRQKGYYESLRKFVTETLPGLDLQLWFPDKDIDQFLFKTDATSKCGDTMVSIILPEDVYLMEMYIAEERVKFIEEKHSSISKYAVEFLGFIAYRHFRTYPFPNEWRDYLKTNFCFSREDVA